MFGDGRGVWRVANFELSLLLGKVLLGDEKEGGFEESTGLLF